MKSQLTTTITTFGMQAKPFKEGSGLVSQHLEKGFNQSGP
jgi:hypothetical protein